jgi:DNA-binding transcriptional regulator GbsR (MarR family)
VKMSPTTESFVVHFGEMGSRWGFNRTVGQMYAIIVLSEEPLSANDIAETLGISRGNVSMGIKELQSWRLIQVQHIAGDRKDYYTTAGSIWEMAKRILEERKRREMDPTLTLLRDTLLENNDSASDTYALERMQEIHDLLETLQFWFNDIQGLSPDKLQTLLKLGSGVGKVLEFTDKLKPGKKKPRKS